MIHLTSEGFASRGGSALLSLPFCVFGWQKLLFSSLLCFPTCLILWGALAPGKWCGQEGRGWHHWEPSLCLSLMLHQLLVGRKLPPWVIAMDLVSGDVLQRINVFMGFLSLCCKKQGSIPGRRGLPKERHISSCGWCCSPVLRCRWCVKHLSSLLKPSLSSSTGTEELLSALTPRSVCSQIHPWLPPEHLEICLGWKCHVSRTKKDCQSWWNCELSASLQLSAQELSQSIGGLVTSSGFV